MTENTHSHDFDKLEPPLEAAVQAVLSEPIPEEAIDRVKSRARQLSAIETLPSRAFANPVDQLRRAKSSDAESIGEEILNGRRTQVYRLRQGTVLGIQKDIQDNARMLVWVDAESQLPAKIVVRDTVWRIVLCGIPRARRLRR